MTATKLLSGAQKVRRRIVFFSLVFLLITLATWVMADILWRGGMNSCEVAILILFAILFTPVSLGIVQALTGFIILWRRRDPARLLSLLETTPALPDLPVTAVVLPIFNEDVSRVYEGLRAIYRSVERTGNLSRFDFFILSDSNDPNKWIEEEMAWAELCKQVSGFGRIFYRKRKIALNRKSGNISDFCRRWGSKYRYMVILDADSVMSGDCLVKLAQLMELNPQAGIIQAAPVQALSESLFGRGMQFAGSLYGPVFQAGLNFWQADEGNYWGHNAIIRLAPFIEHCALPDLPASKTPRAKFMSHDYVEAALMRRAGYEVWLAYGLGGSYEGGPPTLLDMAKRDRRWCRGNFQHSWLVLSPHVRPINRLHLALGIMSYLSSPLWLFFMIIGTLQFWIASRLTVRTFDFDVGLSRLLDVGGNQLAIILFSTTISLLFLPKLLSLLLVLRNKESALLFGGRLRATVSVIIEHFFSMLITPILMLFHSRFVLGVMAGQEVGWGTQRRGGENAADWGEAIEAHGGHTIIGILWGLLAWKINPAFFWWMSPIFIGLVSSIPVSLLLGKVSVGTAMRRMNLFITPQESNPPAELAELKTSLAICDQHAPRLEPLRKNYGFMQVVIDPYVNAIHIALLRRHHKRLEGTYFTQLQDRVVAEGPDLLSRREQMALLMNPECMAWLHEQIWKLPSEKLAPWWTMALRQYNVLESKPQTALYL
ncbi:MAG: glucans biosynthesis glucosyltransferase MdoH [Verrucomicrobia bacterium]|nr:glucans biosynthesis glucosyltransferase MdoH [Verrucomicrobiota bacterium]